MKFLLVASVLFYGSLSQPSFGGDEHYVPDYCFDQGSGESMMYVCSDLGVQSYYYYDSDTCDGSDIDVTEYHGCDSDSGTYYRYNSTDCDRAKSSVAAGVDLIECTYWQRFQYDNPRPLETCMNGGCYDGSADSCWDYAVLLSNGYFEVHEVGFDGYDCMSDANISQITYTNTSYDYVQIGDSNENCFVKSRLYTWATSTYVCNDNGFEHPSPTTDCNYIQFGNGAWTQPDFCYYSKQGYHSYSWQYECQEDGNVKLYHWIGEKDCSGSKYYVREYNSSQVSIKCDGSDCKGERTIQQCSVYNPDKYEYNTDLMCGGCMHYYEDWENLGEPTSDLMYMMSSLGPNNNFLSGFYFFDGECEFPGIVQFDTTGSYSSGCKADFKKCSNKNNGVAKNTLRYSLGEWPF